MSIEQDIAVLETVPMFALLGRQTLRMIAVAAETRDVEAGEVLFAPGQKADCAFVVQAGSFRLGPDADNSPRAIEAGPGTMLGEFALFTDAAQPLTAVAQERSTVMRISRSMFMKILEDDAQAAVRLRDYVARRAQQAVADVARVGKTLKAKGEGQ